MNAARDTAVATTPAGHLPLGEILRLSGKISELDISRVIVSQREGKLRFGEAAQKMGLVTWKDVELALARQFDYPYVQDPESGFSPLLVSACDPFGARADIIRGLRSELSLRWFAERGKALTVISPREDCGSSIIAANLAIAFAQLGESTLLIDADLRNPTQHEIFGIGNGDGLSSVLAGRSQIASSLNAVAGFDHLAVLCAGIIPPNPHELLCTVNFAYLIETAPPGFDVVIVDAPPMLDYPDAQMISARTRAVLLSARRHKTSLADLEHCKTQLAPTGCALLGVVIND